MNQQLIEKMMKQISDDLGGSTQAPAVSAPAVRKPAGGAKKRGPVTELIGTASGKTIGLVIASVDPMLMEVMKLGEYRSLGIIGSRVGAGPQIMAVDDAIKATNTEIISVEYPRDTIDGAGRGSLIYIGARDVSDAKRAVEIALANTEKYFGEVYASEAGHLEFQFTARAGECLEKAYGTPVGKAFGLITGAPAAIGTVLADVAVKAANVEVVCYRSPSGGNSNSNEVILAFTGDSGAVRQAVAASREVGISLLGALGDEPKSGTASYI